MRSFRIYTSGLFILLFSLLLLGACRSKKQTINTDKLALEKSNAEKLETIRQTQANFTTLSVKAKADLVLDGNANDVTINFRILKGQKIWLSVTAIAGLEVARMLITPDSIKVINRLESSYMVKPFSFIHQFTNDQINYGVLEAILVGNAFEEALKQPNFIVDNNQLQTKGNLSTIAYRVNFNEAFKVTDTYLEDTLASQQLLIAYQDFYGEAGLILPHHIKLKTSAGKKSISAEMKYTKIEKDLSLDYPFNVPKRFSVKK
ncbi:MAG: DUF4292 domain-containing protein [Sphingobacteriaceae bacterium]